MVNNKQEDKSVSQVMTKVGGTSLKTLGIYVRNYSILFIIAVVLVIVAWFGGRRLFGAMFQATSPFAQERKDIAQKNNIRDAYSSIIGSDVGVISQNGIIKWFNSKEAKEIDISIPKLINYSPLFDDDTYRNELKDAFSESLNLDALKQSTKNYKVFYDGATIRNNDNNWYDVTETNKKAIVKDLERQVLNLKKIEFKKWSQVGKSDNVDFTTKGKDTVKVDGYFKMGYLMLAKNYHLTAEYKYQGNDYQLVVNTLKVEKVK